MPKRKRFQSDSSEDISNPIESSSSSMASKRSKGKYNDFFKMEEKSNGSKFGVCKICEEKNVSVVISRTQLFPEEFSKLHDQKTIQECFRKQVSKKSY